MERERVHCPLSVHSTPITLRILTLTPQTALSPLSCICSAHLHPHRKKLFPLHPQTDCYLTSTPQERGREEEQEKGVQASSIVHHPCVCEDWLFSSLSSLSCLFRLKHLHPRVQVHTEVPYDKRNTTIHRATLLPPPISNPSPVQIPTLPFEQRGSLVLFFQALPLS